MESLYTIEGLKKLAAIIREARGSDSYRDFQKKTGVSHATIGAIERCERKEPRITSLTKLAPYTSYTVEQLVAIAQSLPDAEQDRVQAFKTAGEVWPIVEMLPKQEAGKLMQLISQKWMVDAVDAHLVD